MIEILYLVFGVIIVACFLPTVVLFIVFLYPKAERKPGRSLWWAFVVAAIGFALGTYILYVNFGQKIWPKKSHEQIFQEMALKVEEGKRQLPKEMGKIQYCKALIPGGTVDSLIQYYGQPEVVGDERHFFPGRFSNGSAPTDRIRAKVDASGKITWLKCEEDQPVNWTI